jgi:hypothetical protein
MAPSYRGEFLCAGALSGMHRVLPALCLLLLTAAPAAAATAPAAPPLLQSWSDPALIAADDDWSRVPAVAGYRGDGLVAEPGVDPRTVVADGSGTPVDVNANRTDPRAVGLAAGVTEFELADPVVAIQGSATASAPHLVLSLDTRGRAEVSVRLELRDVDASGADAVEPVALQYRVGASGDFAAARGGYVADATTGPGAATLVTPVRATLPPQANDQPLVQLRVITTNAVGQDEWVGIDDIDVTATVAEAPKTCPPTPGPAPPPARPGPPEAPVLSELTVSPDTFMPARRGAAIVRRGGAALRFRLTRAARVRFEAIRAGAPEDLAPKVDASGSARAASRAATGAPRGVPRLATGGRFSVAGRRGLNRLRFSGRVRGRALAPGPYVLRAVAVDRAGRRSAPSAVRFRIGRPED